MPTTAWRSPLRVSSARRWMPSWTTSVPFNFDTALSGSPAARPSLLAFTKPDHVLFGSDWPFAPDAAVGYFTNHLDAYGALNPMARQALIAVVPPCSSRPSPDGDPGIPGSRPLDRMAALEREPRTFVLQVSRRQRVPGFRPMDVGRSGAGGTAAALQDQPSRPDLRSHPVTSLRYAFHWRRRRRS